MKPPHDTLAKFMAIGGIVVVFACVGGPGIRYQNLEHKRNLVKGEKQKFELDKKRLLTEISKLSLDAERIGYGITTKLKEVTDTTDKMVNEITASQTSDDNISIEHYELYVDVLTKGVKAYQEIDKLLMSC